MKLKMKIPPKSGSMHMNCTMLVIWNHWNKCKLLGQGKIKVWERNHGFSNNPSWKKKKVMGINYS